MQLRSRVLTSTGSLCFSGGKTSKSSTSTRDDCNMQDCGTETRHELTTLLKDTATLDHVPITLPDSCAHDRTWNPSKPILFSAEKRATACDYTWRTGLPIKFAAAEGSRRGYSASVSKSKPTLEYKPLGPKKAIKPKVPALDPNSFQPKSAGNTRPTYTHAETIRKLEEKHEEKIQKLEEEYQAAMKREQKSHDKTTQALQESRNKVRERELELDRELKRRAELLVEPQKLQKQLEELRLQDLHNVTSLAEERSRNWKLNAQMQSTVHLLDSLRDAKAELEEEIASLRLFKSTHHALRVEEHLKAQRVLDRADYFSYRKVLKDSDGSDRVLMKPMTEKVLQRAAHIRHAIAYWKKSTERFEEFCKSQSWLAETSGKQHATVVARINDFMKSKLTHLVSELRQTKILGNGIYDLDKSYTYTSHLSRIFTRMLRFDLDAANGKYPRARARGMVELANRARFEMPIQVFQRSTEGHVIMLRGLRDNKSLPPAELSEVIKDIRIVGAQTNALDAARMESTRLAKISTLEWLQTASASDQAVWYKAFSYSERWRKLQRRSRVLKLMSAAKKVTLASSASDFADVLSDILDYENIVYRMSFLDEEMRKPSDELQQQIQESIARELGSLRARGGANIRPNSVLTTSRLERLAPPVPTSVTRRTRAVMKPTSTDSGDSMSASLNYVPLSVIGKDSEQLARSRKKSDSSLGRSKEPRRLRERRKRNEAARARNAAAEVLPSDLTASADREKPQGHGNSDSGAMDERVKNSGFRTLDLSPTRPQQNRSFLWMSQDEILSRVRMVRNQIRSMPDPSSGSFAFSAPSHRQISFASSNSGTSTASRTSTPTEEASDKPVDSAKADDDLVSKTVDLEATQASGAKEAHKVLDYQIPPADFRAALLASENSGGAYWKHTLYKSSEGKKIVIHMCRKMDAAERAAKLFIDESVIGFDMEWEMNSRMGVDSIKNNVSLIQIASEDRIALFQLATFQGEEIENLMPPSLKTILESPNIIKAGVNIGGDFTRMRKCLGIQGQGIFELSHLYKVVKYSEKQPHLVNRSPSKMADQVRDILHLPLAKGSVRTSQWSKTLSAEQIEYAATDAYAGFRLYDALEARRKAMEPTPPRPALYELQQPLILGNGEVAPRRTKKEKLVVAEDNAAIDESEAWEDVIDEDGSTDAEIEGSPTEYEDIDQELVDQTEKLSLNPTDLSGTLGESIIPTVRGDASDTTKTSTPDSRIKDADDWASDYRSNVEGGANAAHLRAYALWHRHLLSLGQVASLLKVQKITAAIYLSHAVKWDLPYETNRLREVLSSFSSDKDGRNRFLLNRVLASHGSRERAL